MNSSLHAGLVSKNVCAGDMYFRALSPIYILSSSQSPVSSPSFCLKSSAKGGKLSEASYSARGAQHPHRKMRFVPRHTAVRRIYRLRGTSSCAAGITPAFNHSTRSPNVFLTSAPLAGCETLSVTAVAANYRNSTQRKDRYRGKHSMF